jgi:hypothetical protein
MVSLLRSGWPSSVSSSLVEHRNLTCLVNAVTGEVEPPTSGAREMSGYPHLPGTFSGKGERRLL